MSLSGGENQIDITKYWKCKIQVFWWCKTPDLLRESLKICQLEIFWKSLGKYLSGRCICPPFVFIGCFLEILSNPSSFDRLFNSYSQSVTQVSFTVSNNDCASAK